MIEIPCPHCGPRNASEYRYVGESRTRPGVDTGDLHEWRAYLYLRANAAGWVTETWLHRAGCRRFLTVERHTVTNEVRGAWPVGGGAAGTDVIKAAADAPGDPTADEGGVV